MEEKNFEMEKRFIEQLQEIEDLIILMSDNPKYCEDTILECLRNANEIKFYFKNWVAEKEQPV